MDTGPVGLPHVEPPPARTTSSTRWRSGVAMVAVVVTVSAAAWVSARSVALPGPDLPAASSFVPADGTLAVYELSNAGGETILVQEHQRSLGFEALTSLPQSIAAQVLTALPDDDLAMRVFWRVTSRQMRGGLVGPQTTDVLTVDERGIQRLASFGGTVPSVFQPPLLLMPANASVGDTWTATGSALLDGALGYDHRASIASIDDDGCVVVATKLDVSFAGTLFTSQESSERWCLQQGVASAELVYDQGGGPEPITYALADDPGALVAAEPRPPAAAVGDGGDPAFWEPVPLTPVKRDPFLGDMVVDGITGVPPIAGPGGLLVSVLGNGSDVVGFRVAEPAEGAAPDAVPLEEVWRIHPGGEPLAVAVLDDLVLVATSTRRLAAYDVNGVRRWQIETDDLVLGSPVRARGVDGADAVVVQDLSGRVTAFDAEQGVRRWSGRTRTESDLGPVVLRDAARGDVVVVADRSGDLVAFDGGSGRRLWGRQHPGVDALGVVGGAIVVARGDGSVIALDRQGAQQWDIRVDGRVDRIEHVADWPALIGDGHVTVLDATGRLRWSVPVGDWADGWSGGLAVHDSDRVCVLDVDGEPKACWPSDDGGSTMTVYVVATEEGLWILDSGLGVTFIGPSRNGVAS